MREHQVKCVVCERQFINGADPKCKIRGRARFGDRNLRFTKIDASHVASRSDCFREPDRNRARTTPAIQDLHSRGEIRSDKFAVTAERTCGHKSRRICRMSWSVLFAHRAKILREDAKTQRKEASTSSPIQRSDCGRAWTGFALDLAARATFERRTF